MVRRVLCTVLFFALAANAGASVPRAAVSSADRPAIAEETKRQKIALRRAIATEMRDEVHALRQKRQIREAVILYRQSLVYWPDTGLESYIALLEQRAGFWAGQYRLEEQQAAAGGATTGPDRVFATVRNCSARDIILAVRGEAPEAATSVRTGEIRIRPVSLGPVGEVTFEVSRDGQILESRTWRGIPGYTNVVPALLYDDLKGRLFVMTGLR